MNTRLPRVLLPRSAAMIRWVAPDAWPVRILHVDPECRSLKGKRPRMAQDAEFHNARICRMCGWQAAPEGKLT